MNRAEYEKRWIGETVTVRETMESGEVYAVKPHGREVVTLFCITADGRKFITETTAIL